MRARERGGRNLILAALGGAAIAVLTAAVFWLVDAYFR